MSKDKLRKLGDCNDNLLAQQNQRNEKFMAAWKETLLVIEWIQKQKRQSQSHRRPKSQPHKVDQHSQFKKRKAEREVMEDSGLAPIEKKTKRRNCELNSDQIPREIIYLKNERTQNICITPKPGKNEFVLVFNNQ